MGSYGIPKSKIEPIMGPSTSGSGSCWLVEVTKLKDLTKDAILLALEDNKQADVHIRLVHVMTEVPCATSAVGMELPVSLVDEKAIKEHEQRISKGILRPFLTFLSQKKVKCSAHVEHHDRRERGLAAAAQRYGADRLYISFKKRVFGNPLTGLDAIVEVLSSSCLVVAVYGGKRAKEILGNGEGLDIDELKLSSPRSISSQDSLSRGNLSRTTSALSAQDDNQSSVDYPPRSASVTSVTSAPGHRSSPSANIPLPRTELARLAASIKKASNPDGPLNLSYSGPQPMQQSSTSQSPLRQLISPPGGTMPNEMFSGAPPGQSEYFSPLSVLDNTQSGQYMMPGQSNGSRIQGSEQGMMTQQSIQMMHPRSVEQFPHTTSTPRFGVKPGNPALMASASARFSIETDAEDYPSSLFRGGATPGRFFPSGGGAQSSSAIPLESYLVPPQQQQQQQQWMETASPVLMPGVLYSSDGAQDVVDGAAASGLEGQSGFMPGIRSRPSSGNINFNEDGIGGAEDADSEFRGLAIAEIMQSMAEQDEVFKEIEARYAVTEAASGTFPPQAPFAQAPGASAKSVNFARVSPSPEPPLQSLSAKFPNVKGNMEEKIGVVGGVGSGSASESTSGTSFSGPVGMDRRMNFGVSAKKKPTTELRSLKEELAEFGGGEMDVDLKDTVAPAKSEGVKSLRDELANYDDMEDAKVISSNRSRELSSSCASNEGLPKSSTFDPKKGLSGPQPWNAMPMIDSSGAQTSGRYSISRSTRTTNNLMSSQSSNSVGVGSQSQGRAFSTGRATFSSMEGGSAECRKFSPDQLAIATNNYAKANLLGKGAYGKVFKGVFLGCQVAVKRLEVAGWQGSAEFNIEVEVLSRMRHPHIVLLMGCCLEEMSLIYEYLPGGSLQDKLGPPKTAEAVPLSWADRLRITSEIASALMFLHQNEPPIVHRDLKPENILLDAHSISKIGDVGLARLVDSEDNVTMKVRGTAGYIDPEEVETCEISVLSDVYAFGLIVLQLITGQKYVKSVHRMLTEAWQGNSSLETAVERVMKYVDSGGGEWPREIVQEATSLALECCQRRRAVRPGLADRIHPGFIQLAKDAEAEMKRRKRLTDSQFVCPLSKEVMRDPVVAADGFTYEREHITRWMVTCGLSPSTGAPFPHTCLTPNNALKLMISSNK